MRTLLAGLLAFSLGGLALAANEPPPEGKKAGASASRADRLKALQAEWNEAVAAARKALQEAKTNEERTAARRTSSQRLNELQPVVAEKALALAKEDPKDGTGFDAALLAYQMAPLGSPDQQAAFGLIAEHHATNPKLEQVLPMIVQRPTPEERKFLQVVLEKNPEPRVKGLIAFSLAKALAQAAEGPNVKIADLAAKHKEAVAAFEKVAEEYGDVVLRMPRGKVADLAKQEIEAIHKSPVGKPAKEIEGEDLDGKVFKLSDYRGKVVLLDFWGHW
jgi:hypothetical protein